MMNPKLYKEFNKQIQEEIYSAYLYLSMSAFAASLNHEGIAHWFRVQYLEELDHGLGFYNYLLRRGLDVELLEIAKPPKTFGKDVSNLFAESFKHEQHITSRINLLYEMALALKDYAAVEFLRWYISEQVEEEENATNYDVRMRQVKDTPGALIMLDKELLARVHTPAVIPGATS